MCVCKWKKEKFIIFFFQQHKKIIIINDIYVLRMNAYIRSHAQT